MNSTKIDTRAAKKAAIIDGLQRGLIPEDACQAADVTRRTGYNWRDRDPDFAAAWDAAVEDAPKLVNRRRLADWQGERQELEAELAEIEAALGEVAAPAHAGDPDAQARRDELRARRQQVQGALDALSEAIASAEGHLQRQTAEKAEKERQAAQSEAGEQQQVQADAAARIDAALAEIEDAWQEFNAASISRSVASRRAGHRHRAAHDRLLVQAAFAKAPAASSALGLDRMLKTRHCRPLSETCK